MRRSIRRTKIGKMDHVTGYLDDLAAHFFPGSQVQLDTFSGAALKKAGDGTVWLESGFFLSEQIRTSNRGKEDYDNE